MLGVRKILARLREDVVALVYPPQCLLCLDFEVATYNRFLCENCWLRTLAEPIPPLRNWKLDHPSATVSEHCDFDLAAWQYQGAMAMLIPAMKYREHPSFAKMLGAPAAERLREPLDFILPSQPVLIPVPLHLRRQRERGFNQSTLIAAALAQHLHLEMWSDAVRRVRFTDTQASLNAIERMNNVADAFAAKPGLALQGRAVLLVDDVITTGATISACARVAKEAGATHVGAVALARVGR